MELSQNVLEVLRRDEGFVLYRGTHSSQPGSASVLLLAPASMQPALATLKKIEHEYSLRDELDSAWAVRSLAVSEQRGRTTLVLEDPGGETLDRFLPGPMEMTQFLRFAVGLATALGGLHKRELIHKDVKPANVLVNPATGQVRLMGFGIASRLPRERQAPDLPEFIAGTLPYMAPEQTGRMNRTIDSRSDLYALGVTLYEMLTGSLPFTASDPMELVHCHMARQPTPPCERSKGVSRAVSAIIMKLLAKTAEDRYQTAAGVESDLRRCLAEWETQNRIDEFQLGEQDKPDRLLIPEKLYGREPEIGALLTAFDRVVAGGRPELVLVSGYSGIGKSSVVNELHKQLVQPRGLFASGKFDQYKRDIPYATLAQAFQSLLRPLLTTSEAELSKWRDALREAVGLNGQLIVDLVPELKLIIGEQPPVPELPLQDAQGRFQLVFRRFISVFARAEHPLALFFDDLQWLDAATLDLIEDMLIQPDVQHLLLIGAYRNNEVDPGHPLTRKLEAIRKTGAVVSEITLAPLAPKDVTQLTADALHCEPNRVTSLVQMVYDKTAGNPFFTIQFISSLAEEGLLTFEHVGARWSWDVDRIRAKGYTDNVVDLMVGKLTRLPAVTQEALKHLACLGHAASVKTLSLVYGTTEEQVHSDLREALCAELIERKGDSYKFIHDRVQEAAYSMIPEGLRPQEHLRIGRSLAAQTPEDRRHEAIFEIVNQLNRGAALISSVEEREQVAELNLMAGKRAKASTAYASALSYFSAGSALLMEDRWMLCYDLAFALELSRAECELLTGHHEAAEERLLTLDCRAANQVDRAAVTCLKVELYTIQDQSERAVAVCLEYLRQEGIAWSAHPTGEDVRLQYDRLWQQIGSRSIEALVDLPEMNEPGARGTMDVLTRLFSAANFTDENLSLLVATHMANWSLGHGNTHASCCGYAWLAMMAGAVFGDYSSTRCFGQLAVDLVEKRGLTSFAARVYLTVACAVIPWTQPISAGQQLFRRALDVAEKSGDLTYTAYAFSNLVSNLLTCGDPLHQIHAAALAGIDFARATGFGLVVDMITSQVQLISTLQGVTRDFGAFNDAAFDESAFEQHLEENSGLSFAACRYWIRKMQARVWAQDHAAALAAAAKAQALLWTQRAFIEHAEYHFYAALARAASCNEVSAETSAAHFTALAEHHSQLEKWADVCFENFADRSALVAAEIARLEAREIDAERLYERAIRLSREQGFVQNEGLAYELASRFYAARGFDVIADAYLRAARQCHFRWGALGKVKQLDQLHPRLHEEMSPPGSTSTITGPVDRLDLGTVLKISQAVSGEMVLEKLIDRLMRAAIEHAGAERGLLIVPRGDELQIEAEATTTGEDVTVHLVEGAHAPAVLPESLVRYVMRTREIVILDDASSRNPFSADPYIVHHRARSILCLALIKQGKLIGILYLENNLTPHVFTPDRVTVLKVLASHAAISLENARLYRDLQDREGKIRRLVDSNVVGVVMWTLDGAIVGANEAFLHMVQYGHEDIASGRVRWTDLTPAEWRERDERALAELNSTGTFQPFEKEYFRKDGSRVPVLIGGTLFQEGGNEGVAFVLDLSEQKRAEEALRSSEAYLAEAQRLSQTGSFGWYVSSGEIFWSDETYRIFEYDRSVKPTIDSVVQRVHPQDRADFQKVIDGASRGATDFEHTYRLLLPDGRTKHIHALAHALADTSGNREFVGAAIDVTSIKQAEEELHKSELYLAEGQRLGHTGSWAFNAAGFEYWSSELFRIYGLDPSGKPPTVEEYLDLVHPEDREFMEQGIQKMLADHRQFDFTKRIVRPDGKTRFVRCVGVPRTHGETFLGFVGTGMDVTEQEQLTQELQRRESYLAEAQRLSQTGSWAWSPDQDIRYWSEECYRVLSFDPQDGLPRFEEFFQRIHPDDQPGFRELIQTAIREKAEWEADYRIVHPDGPVRDIHVVGHPVLSTSGHLVEFVGTVIDVTERKRAEEELRRSEMELRQMLDLAPQLVAVFGPNRERLYANRILLDYLGLTLEEWRQTFDRGEFLHPDDRERVQGHFDRALSSGAGIELELRLRKGDGSYRWFLARYNPVRDDKGQIMRWYAASTDIEDRKRAEERLQYENVVLREELDKASMFEEIVGTSPALKSVLSRISKVAPSDSTVLITGETGTGKELVARAIHRRSNRASRAFVSVNCAAIPRDLIASELFGHEKGAFTGATQQRVGRFELASGGTIFLDEVGELPTETQIALLRVLQEHEFERVGGSRRIRADVRVIAATNRNLQAAISAGSFRSDLFYRLHVFPVDVPSLRERREDIPLLVEYFIDRYARKAGKNIKRVSQETLELLQSYAWPGNIRELQNVIERSVILCETEIFSIDENWLPKQPSLTEPKNQMELPGRLLAQEKDMIEAALKDTRGRVFGPTGAAAKLGIPRSTLESKIKSLKIDKNRFRTSPET